MPQNLRKNSVAWTARYTGHLLLLTCFCVLLLALSAERANAQNAGWSPSQQRQQSWVPRWIPSITRSTLLPHRFSGICMNCHAILGGSPTPIDRRTIDSVGLNRTERALVLAGQQVRTPSIISDIKAPLVGRNAILRHKYWGVCSNCHSIVEAGAGPSPEQIRRGMLRAKERLLDMQLSNAQISYASPDIGIPPSQYASYFFGFAAFLLLLASLAYPVMEGALRRNQKRYAAKFDIPKWKAIHYWSGIGFAICAVIHWGLSPRGNAILHGGLILAISLTLSGMAYRVEAAKRKKPLVGWLHAQRYLTYLMVGVVLAGHLAVSSIWLE